MIKLLAFDLDGVIYDSKMLHFDALNQALLEIDQRYVISYDEHLKTYDGLPTTAKLKLLTVNKGLSVQTYDHIWMRKQLITNNLIDNITPNQQKINLFKELKKLNYKIYVCSNSIRKTVNNFLKKLELYPYVDKIISNEDVAYEKPHPQMYLQAMVDVGVYPKETLVIEDSPKGKQAAIESGAWLCSVNDATETTLEHINKTIDNCERKMKGIKPKWHDDKLTVLIPMAGAGSRFEQVGFEFPKPLIPINSMGGKPMIQVVTENLNIDANFIYIVQKKHYEKYNLSYLLNLIKPNCKIVQVDGVTAGAACTTLLAKEYINNKNPLLIANSDQYLEWDSSDYMYFSNSGNLDGSILTFKHTHPKWSFVKLNDDGYIVDVQEKKPISDVATVGLYFWKRGEDYVKYAEQMISKGFGVGQEFNGKAELYVAPVYNEAIQDGFKIKPFNIEKNWGLGTPSDLKYFEDNYGN